MNIKDAINELESLVEEFGDDIELKIQQSIFEPLKDTIGLHYDEEEKVAYFG